MFAVKWLTNIVSKKFTTRWQHIVLRHNKAVLSSSAAFIDASVYLSVSIYFAAIIFNYSGDPLLYEDKLGQISTLLAVDAPVAMLLLTYQDLGQDRENMRISLCIVSCLMTFIIQFLFRRVKDFDPASSLCLDWNGKAQKIFRSRFTMKAVWASCVCLFFMCHFVPLYWAQMFRRKILPEGSPKIWDFFVQSPAGTYSKPTLLFSTVTGSYAACDDKIPS